MNWTSVAANTAASEAQFIRKGAPMRIVLIKIRRAFIASVCMLALFGYAELSATWQDDGTTDVANTTPSPAPAAARR